ncbi:uncharacterized protein BDR25DRAFT_301992 [Lindgomyces ingoldianus]|uniref:Uncharacterized protein n=1 Tax=Lindgomyces ingoldianus TaxID=673940 RepID=A0ACB6R519_9PLEO|nr:uncharacterized protein BDR25DRAFT_301992 [Lindgomyces ingoldianus]KAF2473933.1 hypothetical protein BDR25DRAFT_301992 [Lindgomyces ingoldianus]
MAAQLPNINVIQDTPTSPNHAPAPIYTAPATTSRSPPLENSAPEVHLANREVEGLQVDPNGPYPQPTTSESRPAAYGFPYFVVGKQAIPGDESGLIPVPLEKHSGVGKRTCGMKRRTFIIVLVVVVIVIICGAVGGGVGGYYAKQNSNPEPPYVTSGTSGMAKLPCSPASATAPGAPAATPRELKQPYLARGATFNITCRRGEPAGTKNNGRPVVNLGIFTEYTFKSCMDRCANLTECGGVAYGANLTDMVQDGDPGGNCLLKNGTWDASANRDTWFASGVKQNFKQS